MFDTQAKFTHRPLQNDGYASVCTRCFVTVGSGRTQEDLDEVESKHVCDKEILRRLGAH